MTTRYRLLVAALLAPSFNATAQAIQDTTFALPNVTVTATRTQTDPARAPLHVSVLGSEAIQATASANVAELLEARSFGFIKRYGDTGIATLSLRGATASETLILLDGYRITDPQLGELDLSLLPAVLLESVEIASGPASALYGTDGLGGVVNLRTFAAGASPRSRARIGYGAWGERTAGVMAAGGRGRLSALAAFDYDTAEGDFRYVNEALFPPREVSRTGADRVQRSFYSAARYAGEVHRLHVAGWYTAAERGLPGIATSRPQGERMHDGQLRFWGSDDMQLGWGRLRVGGFVQRGELRYTNPQLELDETGRTLLGSAEAELTAALSSRWLLGAGASAGYSRARHPSLKDAHDLYTGTFFHGTGSYGRLLLYPALRVDFYRPAAGPERIVPSPRLGLNVQPLAGRPLYLKASLGRAFRSPTFNERFWLPGGNPDLRPEQGWAVDGGAYLGLPRSRFELSAFGGRTRDQIVWLPAQAGHYGAFNLAEVQRLGFELAAHRQWALPAGISLNSGLIYTFVDARDRSDPSSGSYGKQVRYVPREQTKGYLTARLGSVSMDLNGRYAGRRYITTDGSQALNPYVVLDAQLRLRRRVLGFSTELSLSVENVLEAEYAVIQGYPMPPRHASLRLLIETTGR